MDKYVRRCVWILLVAMAGLPMHAWSQDAKAMKVMQLFKEVTGKDADKLTLKDFLTDQGAAGVSAASLVGFTGTTAIVDDTKDFAALISPFDSSGKGGAFVVSPARIRNPVPRIDLRTEYIPSGYWRAVAALAISGAQNKTTVSGKDYRRRAISLSTSAYLNGEDDPIVRRAKGTLVYLQNQRAATLDENSCAAKLLNSVDDAGQAKTGPDTDESGESLKDKAQIKAPAVAFRECVEKQDKQARGRWFASRWSLALGTGDVGSVESGRNVGLGTVVAGGVTLGKPLGSEKDRAAEIYSGIAVTLAARVARGEPVLASLATGPVQRQDTSLVAARLMYGTESLRLLGEWSNQSTKQAASGQREFKRALGVDTKVMKDSWLSLRYGRRAKVGGGDESATLLSLTLGGDLLSF